MAYFRYNRILLFFIAIGLAAALFIVWQRHQVEVANSTVELVMDYEDIIELARIEGKDPEETMRRFREAGITSAAVYDTTLEKLHKSGQITAISGADLLHQHRAGALVDPRWRSWLEAGRITSDSVYITGGDAAVFAEVKSDLIRRFSSRVSELDSKAPVLAVKGSYEKLTKADLGLSSAEIRDAAKAGFLVIVRPANYNGVQPEDIRTVFARMAGVDKVSAILFSGTEALGYPHLLDQTLGAIRERGITLGLIEHPVQLQFYNQEGALGLAPQLQYQIARVYSIPKDEQPKLKLAEATHRWALSDQERNIRINLMRRYDKPFPGQTLLETNLLYASQTKQAVEAKGFTLGKAGVFKPYFPSPWLTALAVAGVIAAGVVFLTQLHPFLPRYQYILFTALTVLFVLPILTGAGTLARQAAAFGAAVVFPVLAMTVQLDRWRTLRPQRGGWPGKIISDGLTGLALAFLMSLVGAGFLAAILSDIRFLLEIEIFRGVKLTFILPLVLITAVYLTRYNLLDPDDDRDAGRVWRQVRKILQYPVSVRILLLVAAGAVAAWIFIGRSGHTAGVPVPAIEVKIRAFLERVMYARPREKEFLIGHPAFLLAVMAAYRQWPRLLHFILVIGATIGQSTLVETFAHLRTPVLMSLIRGLDGLVLGAVLGILAVIGVQFLAYLSFILARRTETDE